MDLLIVVSLTTSFLLGVIVGIISFAILFFKVEEKIREDYNE